MEDEEVMIMINNTGHLALEIIKILQNG